VVTIVGLILACDVQFVLAQNNISEALQAPQLEWSKTFGTGNSDSASCIIQTADGGFALIGTEGHGYFPSTVLLVKTDAEGTVEWNKTFDDLNRACAIVQTPDGGYAFAGACEVGVALVKIDSVGNTQWTQNYTVFFQGSNGGDPLSMVQTKDGGYAIAGACQVYLYGGSQNHALLLKVDAEGSMQWSNTYGGAGIDYARSVIQTSDGGYAIAGCTSSYGAGDFDYWLVKTDAMGNALWNQTYGAGPQTESPTSLMIGFPGDDEANSLAQTQDGGYALLGNSFSFSKDNSSDAWLVKTDGLGNMQWNKTYGGAGNQAASCIIRTSDGGYAFAGSAPHFEGQISGFLDFWLVKIDADGNIHWNQTFGGMTLSGPDSDVANWLIETSDGAFVLAGSTNPGSTSHGGYYFLVKTNPVLNPPLPTSTSSSSIAPSPTASPTPSPTPSPTHQPTIEPSSTPVDGPYTGEPDLGWILYAIIAVIVVTAIAGLIYFNNRKG
jgi:hypothetical protein